MPRIAPAPSTACAPAGAELPGRFASAGRDRSVPRRHGALGRGLQRVAGSGVRTAGRRLSSIELARRGSDRGLAARGPPGSGKVPPRGGKPLPQPLRRPLPLPLLVPAAGDRPARSDQSRARDRESACRAQAPPGRGRGPAPPQDREGDGGRAYAQHRDLGAVVPMVPRTIPQNRPMFRHCRRFCWDAPPRTGQSHGPETIPRNRPGP